ncbi:hypothetical protein [Paenibacillus polymyxa]|uniref:Uncharacterized protein n=1 Tax=Paenibacillus polymyxa (strain SC2) TaxID=886882 RepID=E3ELD9_PAEPS|nr:hypothetical protein [Paenibacillus polymyxa]ADO59971.1 hypothetical protein PPSC2_28325 [Paenibacillus polymyxa SC2]WPQ59811.1 hypothetical protein SKN87_26340 [Paenibacillus polymyxa]
MKMLFLSPSELSQKLKHIIEKREGALQRCEIGYSEALQTDVAAITYVQTTKEVPIVDFVHDLNREFEVEILSYDVIEVGDFGEGFAFMIR